MAHVSPEEITGLLEAVQQGDRGALDALFSTVYEELRSRAHGHRQRWHGDDTLNTTVLVHEAYLKLVDQKPASWETRAHFLATAAKAMRHILIDYARDQRAQKRGGDRPNLSLEEIAERVGGEVSLTEETSELLVSIDDALRRLEEVSERQSRIVECRFFGGMTIQETAAALGISTATVSRGWVLAKVRMYQDVKEQQG